MYGRSGLERFKKAQSLEPFSVSANRASQPAPTPASKPGPFSSTVLQQSHLPQKPAPDGLQPVQSTAQITPLGGGQSTWQPPDWAIEPRPGVYYLDVLKDGEILDRVNLDKRRHIFGRQLATCDFVLDHQSVSRQHAAVIPHKNGSIYVIDLGSAHGTFVANERLTKDTPVELEVGQSLRFAASTRIYVLRKNDAALFPPPPPTEINLPPSPDPSDEEAVVEYNTILNRYGLVKPGLRKSADAVTSSGRVDDRQPSAERAAKRIKKMRVSFRDQVGGELVEVVGISDGADVGTEPGPVGVKEGSLVGKYESLVQITVIPKGTERSSKKDNPSHKGVTNKLEEVLKKVKTTPPKGGVYDDLYGDLFSGKVGSSWASSALGSASGESSPSRSSKQKTSDGSNSNLGNGVDQIYDDDNDDLFGD